MTCPCGSGQRLESCCQPYIDGARLPPTAEALMRARYTAYATGNVDFVIGTQEASEDTDRASTEAWSRKSKWLGLEVRSVADGQPGDRDGTVEFIARYAVDGEEYAHHEVATFRKNDGRWRLVDSKMKGSTFRRSAPKIGPNERCPCGSGKKYKKCCGKAAGTAAS